MPPTHDPPTPEPPADPLTPKQQAAILALLSEPTIWAAAARARTNERTVRRWLKQSEFKAALWAARQELMVQVTAQLQQAASAAVATLVRNLDCGRPGDEIRAAVAVLDKAQGVGELTALADQLTELVRRLDAR